MPRQFFLLVSVLSVALITSNAFAQSDEAVFWQSISNSSDGAEFCAYLEALPNGKFAALAKLRAKKLGTTCGQAAAQPSAPVVSQPKTKPAPAQTQVAKPVKPQPVVRKTVERTRVGTTTDLREFLRTTDDGVAIKWEGGYCTRLQGNSTGRESLESGGPLMANDFFDSQGSIGT